MSSAAAKADAAAAAAAAAPDAPAVVLPPPVFLHVDMPEAARLKCVEFALEALAKCKVEKDQAMHVKKALEAWNGALWVVVIGAAFGASVAHENAALCMFRVGRAHVLCFQSYDEGALINTKKGHAPAAAEPAPAAAEDAAAGAEGKEGDAA